MASLCSVGLAAISITEVFLRQGIFGSEETSLEVVSIAVGGCAFWAILLAVPRHASSTQWVIASGVIALCAWMLMPSVVLTVGSPAPLADSVVFFFVATMVSFAGSIRFIAGAAAVAVFVGLVLRGAIEKPVSSGDA